MGATLLRSAAHPQQYPPYSTAIEAGRPSPAGAVVQQLKWPCEAARGGEESALCAQWRSATGTQEAANWAWWQLLVSTIGVLGLGVTLYFNFRAVQVASDSAQGSLVSADSAQRAAAAAHEANTISKEGMHRQLRPYVYLTECHINWLRMGGTEYAGKRADLTLYFKNFGQTPAKYATLRAQTRIGEHFNEEIPD